MIDPKVLASIDAHAILRNLEDFTDLVPEASKIIGKKRVAIRFSIPELDKLTLKFDNGKCRAMRGDDIPCNMNLRFTSPEHFIAMIKGTKMPIPTSGFHHLGFLAKDFIKLTDLMTEYLKPDPERLKNDAEFRKVSTILTAYVACFALCEIANLDKVGKVTNNGIEDGVISFEIKDELYIHIVKKDGKLTCVKGAHPQPDAFMIFDTIDTACGVLNGTLDSFACIGAGKLTVKGHFNMIDNLNRLLNQVQFYSAEV
ncbi:MAG: SCP2 sterol-binding domain-containing protein [Clostridia bacterium]|nr:SCP2 sterol-binding domain-containing protein [Clostridia bacterium]